MKAQSGKVQITAVPSPEVREPGTRARRAYTTDYKMRVLKEADLCRGEAGAVTALLRREGLYSSLLSEWRKQRNSGALSAFSQKRGRKPRRTAEEIENEGLRKQNAMLAEKLRQANLIIEAQKKIAEILGNPIRPTAAEMS